MEATFWEETDLIYAYTRAQAIADGELVDVSETAREAGFRFPVAVTRALWALIEQLTKHEDTAGRLWDVLWMASIAARRHGGSHIQFDLHLTDDGRKKLQTLKMLCGPGDDSRPVITIMFPEED